MARSVLLWRRTSQSAQLTSAAYLSKEWTTVWLQTNLWNIFQLVVRLPVSRSSRIVRDIPKGTSFFLFWRLAQHTSNLLIRTLSPPPSYSTAIPSTNENLSSSKSARTFLDSCYQAVGVAEAAAVAIAGPIVRTNLLRILSRVWHKQNTLPQRFLDWAQAKSSRASRSQSLACGSSEEPPPTPYRSPYGPLGAGRAAWRCGRASAPTWLPGRNRGLEGWKGGEKRACIVGNSHDDAGGRIEQSDVGCVLRCVNGRGHALWVLRA